MGRGSETGINGESDSEMKMCCRWVSAERMVGEVGRCGFGFGWVEAGEVVDVGALVGALARFRKER